MIADGTGAVEWRAWFDRVDHDIDHWTLQNLFPLPEETAENQREFDVCEYSPGEYRTDLPPPPGFEGQEFGTFGDEGYDRALSPEEYAVHVEQLARLPARPAADDRRARGRQVWMDYFGAGQAGAPDPGETDAVGGDEAPLAPIEYKSADPVPSPSLPPRHRHRAVECAVPDRLAGRVRTTLANMRPRPQHRRDEPARP